MIAEASWPNTRLSVTDWLFGCAKVTDSPAAMPKLCQLMTALWLAWVTVRLLGAVVMLALPVATAPPVGTACAVLAISSSIPLMQLASRRAWKRMLEGAWGADMERISVAS